MAAPQDRLTVRRTTVFGVALAAGTVSVVALRWWQTTGGDLPYVSPLLAALLAIVAAVVLVLGLRVRRWVGRGDLVDGPGAARTLVLGQTAALGGAVAVGYLAASLGLALAAPDAPDPQAVARSSGLALAAALAAVVAGLVTQWCCRVPPRDDDTTPPPTR